MPVGEPFRTGEAVWRDGEFFGHDADVEVILRAAKASRPERIIVQGARRIGKSSIAQRARTLLARTHACVFLDLTNLVTSRDAWEPGALGRAILLKIIEGLEGAAHLAPGALGRDLTAHAFRTRAVPALRQGVPDYRPVIFLDELQVLAQYDRGSLFEVADAFSNDEPRLAAPLLVMCWGLPWARAHNHPVLTYLTKNAEQLSVRELDDESARRLVKEPLAGSYDYEPDALQWMLTATRLHPLFLNALAAQLLAGRRGTGSREPVAVEEAYAALPGAVDRVRNSLDHAWDQIPTEQQLVMWAILDRSLKAGRFLRSCGQWVGLADIQAALAQHGVHSSVGGWGDTLQGLADNHVLEKSGEGYRAYSVFIEEWLSGLSLEEVLSARSKGDAPSWAAFEQGIEDAKRGDHVAAAGAFRRAELNRHLWQASLELARSLIVSGEHEDALGRLRQLVRLRPGQEDVDNLYRGALLALAHRALDSKRNPSIWLAELERVDPNFVRTPGAAVLACQYELHRWHMTLLAAPRTKWGEITDGAARRAPARWWRHLLTFYCDELRGGLQDPDRAAFSVDLAQEVFLLIVDHLPPENPLEVLVRSIHDVASTIVVSAETREMLARLEESLTLHGTPNLDDSIATAWHLTVRTMRSALGRDAAVRPAFLEALTLYAPKAHGVEMVGLCRDHFPRLFRRCLGDRIDQGTAVLRWLVQHGEKSGVDQALEAIEEAVLVAFDSLDNQPVRALFRDGAAMFAHLLDGYRIEPVPVREARGRDVLGLVELVLQRIAAPRDVHERANDEPWRLVQAEFGAVPEWLRLIDRLRYLDEGRASHLATHLAVPASAHVTVRPLEPKLVESPEEQVLAIKVLLGQGYSGLQRTGHIARPDLPPNAVTLFTGVLSGDPVLIRAFRIVGTDEQVEFLRALWETERRALYNLSTRRQGRALPRFIDAKFDEGRRLLVLVTEAIPSKTLREELGSGRRGYLSESRRPSLWRHLAALIEAVAALHAAGYLHRTIRPETIHLDPATEVLHRPWLKLTGFEWSVYLHALSAIAGERGVWDRYSSPETLSAVFGASMDDGVAGEGFGSDIYSLGLVLFEALVRPLAVTELGQYVRAQAYSRDGHVKWILSLHEESRTAHRSGLLNQDELGVLLHLLEPDVRRRPNDLHAILEIASMLALRGGTMRDEFAHKPLAAVTTLRRQDEKQILQFLERAVDLGPVLRNERPLKEFVEELLKGAKVYPDVAAKERRLLLVGSRVTFVAKPLDWDGTVWDQLAFVEVAKHVEIPKTPPVAVLGSVQLHNADSLLRIPALLPFGGWQDLFNTMRDRPDVLDRPQRDYLRSLALSVEIERRMWAAQAQPYQLLDTQVMQRPGGEQEVAILAARQDAKGTLARSLVAQLERETLFVDLQPTPDPIVPFREQTRWQIDGFTPEGHVRVLRRRSVDSVAAPARGYVRPGGLAGARALYQRRQEILRELEEDPFLLTAVTEPSPIDLPVSLDAPYNKGLDDNKKEMVEAILGRRPLFVVQGPPGTGKTTLAAEVILQTLKANPSARILITSQAHEPLNNLLTRVDDALRERGDRESVRPMSIRLLSEDRLDVARYGQAATQVGRDFHPSAKAAQVLREAKGWRKNDAGVQDSRVIDEWASVLRQAEETGLSAVLESRIVNSASLVYATANDRRLAAFREDAFDLVIYEEAARAYPIEVLGPMRLARRWLLIGDHQQLLPFGIDDFKKVLDDWFDERRAGVLSGDDTDIELREDLEEWLRGQQLSDVKQNLLKEVSLFQNLHERGLRTTPPLSGRLTQQWRMAPAIGEMLGHVFYPHLENAPGDALVGRAHRLTDPREIRGAPLVWLDTKWVTLQSEAGEQRSKGGGFENSFEARALLGFFATLRGRRFSTSIIAPYRAQARAIRAMVGSWQNDVTGPLAQSVATVDSFQGKQSGIVAVSLVRNNAEIEPRRAIGFLNDVARATVMFSRAESLLVVVGCSTHFQRFPESIIGEMYRYFETHGLVLSAGDYVDDSTLNSIRRHREKLNAPWEIST